MHPVIQHHIGTIIKNGGIAIRDIQGGEEPFVYSSGNRGPGYVDIKGQCGDRALSDGLAAALAAKLVIEDQFIPEAVAGNVTGGLGPGWKICDAISVLLGYDIPYVYVRDTRKVGGHQEKVTGKWALEPGMQTLVVEEMTNFCETTTNSARYLRDQHGLNVEHAGCYMAYAHSEAIDRLNDAGVELHTLFTLDQALEVGVDLGLLEGRLVEDYRAFLAEPVKWQLDRGYALPEKG